MSTSPEAGHGLTRRRVLGAAAAAGGLAAAATVLPPNVRTALASPPPSGAKLGDIKHVVMLMQENRSFDHYFGTLSGVRGFDDPRALRLPNGQSVFHQPDPSNPDGYLLPYRLNTKISAAQAIPSTSHAWGVQHQAWNGGKMDNWLPAHLAADGATKSPYTMGYFTREDIPFQYALADAFTICDAYHCSVLGPTWPNRYMWLSGTIDADAQFGGPSLETGKVPDGHFTFKTYPERLTEAGVSWKVYHSPGGATGLPPFSAIKQYHDAKPGDPLYEQAMKTTPLGQFEYDAMNDQLPTVSWLLPPSAYDEHPANLPAAGATFVASKIDAIAANPEVWAKTVFILSYDENDGLFDHVLPPTPPAGTPGEFVTATSPSGIKGGGLPTGLGYRVPCIVVSPWTAGGWVSSETFDHTSQLRLLEKITGVAEPNISAWRRETVGDLTSVFRFTDSRKAPPVLPDTSGVYTLAQYEVAQLPKPTAPTSGQEVPHQERGHRPHVS
ncbi:alkaline phosphatase family protein [Amycolatopsis sp. FDAARGOS 1241]|uniref:alkaline phosphatase family protein n=1 Tax=Amycolatopsis sp. FDAARGOS 1241 TaxID=2778070 RepID=UPI00194E5D81|nr:alkaline phosphatase family protein [Amycolatopsis sp. FDAARGOS 1241]QRP49483.1 twin-arginine translocation signal domain-containing protein [Amycolatopsis sp. FDAARGOS 1241]